jgi:hypothetical protein
LASSQVLYGINRDIDGIVTSHIQVQDRQHNEQAGDHLVKIPEIQPSHIQNGITTRVLDAA